MKITHNEFVIELSVEEYTALVNLFTPAATSPFYEMLDEVEGLLDDGQKIKAIKAVRGFTNCGLREAKDAVELPSAHQRRVEIRHLSTLAPYLERKPVEFL